MENSMSLAANRSNKRRNRRAIATLAVNAALTFQSMIRKPVPVFGIMLQRAAAPPSGEGEIVRDEARLEHVRQRQGVSAGVGEDRIRPVLHGVRHRVGEIREGRGRELDHVVAHGPAPGVKSMTRLVWNVASKMNLSSPASPLR